MTSINELGQQPDHSLAVRIYQHEKLAQRLNDLVVTMKEAVAMDIRIEKCFDGNACCENACCFTTCCAVSIYHPNNESISATRKERLRLSAISMSSEQSQTAATGDSVWLGIEPYAALYTLGERREFVFEAGNEMVPKSSIETFATDLGLSILRNAHLVECLRVNVKADSRALPFLKTFFSLDAWKEAFPSLRSVYLGRDGCCSWQFDLPPHLLKYVHGLDVFGTVQPVVLPHIESMIRKKDYGIQEVNFDSSLLKHAALLDDTLRRVRSFRVNFESENDVNRLAGSFERTKAHGDNLVRLRVDNYKRGFRTMAMNRILRSRPNIQILNLGTVSLSTFVVLCPVLASSILTTLKVGVGLKTAVEDKTLADGVEMQLQHSTIRDLDLTVVFDKAGWPTSQMEGDSVYHFERCVAEGLRATSLRRFHLTVQRMKEEKASVAALTKMYENAWENWSLMDIRLEGKDWLPDTWSWSPLPIPLSGFDFISSRNRFLMLDENTVPPGLWPLFLERCPRWGQLAVGSSPSSVLFYVLTIRPHLVKGKVESSMDADAEKSVDGPGPKRPRNN